MYACEQKIENHGALMGIILKTMFLSDISISYQSFGHFLVTRNSWPFLMLAQCCPSCFWPSWMRISPPAPPPMHDFFFYGKYVHPPRCNFHFLHTTYIISRGAELRCHCKKNRKHDEQPKNLATIKMISVLEGDILPGAFICSIVYFMVGIDKSM
jgi:hypothetical protein